MINPVFNLFGRSKNKVLNPACSGETVRSKDLEYLQRWSATRSGVEGFVEPETLVNEMSVVLLTPRGVEAQNRGS